MASIRQLYVTLSLRAEDFNNKIREAQREAKEFEKTMKPSLKALDDMGKLATSAGKTLTASLTLPLAGFAAVAVQQFSQAAEATALIENAIRSTGGAAGKTADELKRMATSLQAGTLFEDDEILRKVTTNLLTFTNVSGDAFTRAQEAALNLSTVLGQDLQSSTIQIGKALNDPIAGMSALQRIGVKLTDEQKELVKSFVEVGDVASAQNVILNELQKEFGGAAEAAARVGSGPLKQLQNQLGNVTEKFGEIILTGIQPLIGHLNRAVTWFDSLSDSTKKTLVIFVALVAALGPLLIAVGAIASGIAALIPLATSVGAALGVVATVLTGPVGIVIAITAAIAALGYFASKNETVRQVIGSVWNWIKVNVGDVLTSLMDLWRTVADSSKRLWEQWGPAILRAFKIWTTETLSTFRILWETLGPIVRQAFELIKTLITSAFTIIKGNVQVFTGLLTGNWSLMAEGLKNIWRGLWEAIKGIVTAPLKAVRDSVSGFASSVIQSFKDMYDAVVGQSFVPDLIEGIRTEFGKLHAIMVTPTQSATRSVINSFASMAAAVAQGQMSLGSGLTGLAKQGGFSLLNKIPGLETLFSAIPGIGQLAGFGVAKLVDAIVGQFGKGRRTADLFVQQLQNPFGDLLGTITNREDLETAWAKFNQAAAKFAAEGDIEAKVVRQAHSTLDPLIEQLRRDLPSQQAVTNQFYITQQPDEDMGTLVNRIALYLSTNQGAAQQVGEALGLA